MKKGAKKIVLQVVIGVLLGLLLCLSAYFLLTVFLKNNPSAGNTDKVSREELTEKEPDAGQNTEKEEAAVSLRPENYGNVAWAGTLLASDTLVPKTIETVLKVDSPAGIEIPQGGCTDGKYYYQAFIHTDTSSEQLNNQCMVAKYDMKTGQLVKTSEVLQLNHANDITYNSRLDCLVITHNQPVANCITYLNPDTLKVTDQFAIDYFLFSIDYNAARDQYVIGQTSSQTFLILNSEFEAVTKVFQPSARTKSFTTQGMAADDDFIYFLFYKTNVISVYDWNGNFVTLIELEDHIQNERYEPENLTVINGEIYVGCARKIGKDGFCAFKLSDFVPKPGAEKKN